MEMIKRTKINVNANGDKIAYFGEDEARECYGYEETWTLQDMVDDLNPGDPAWKYEVVEVDA